MLRPTIIGVIVWKHVLLTAKSWFSLMSFILLTLLGVGLVYTVGSGSSTQYLNTEPASQIMIAYVFISFLNGMIGRNLALSLLKDRQIKFRFALKNLGVRLSEYYLGNFLFSLMYNMVMLCLFLFFLWMYDSISPLISDARVLVAFIFATFLFCLTYSSMCAFLSGLIQKYNNSSDLMSLGTFLINFIPIMLFMIQTRKNLAAHNEDYYDGLYVWHWSYCFMPNMIFYQLMLSNYNEYYYRALRNDIPNNQSPRPVYFYACLAAQLFVFTTVYIILDLFVSMDTGNTFSLRCRRKVKASTDCSRANSIRDVDETQSDWRLKESDEELVLQINNVWKTFPNKFTALMNINVDIKSNQVTTILGHNGAGKTTLIDLLTCYSKPSEGQIFLNNLNIHEDTSITLGKIGYASMNDPVFDELRVYEYLELVAMLKGVKNIDDHLGQLLKMNNLVKYRDSYIHQLSGGTRRRVTVAAAFIGEPNLIFLDEPSTGVDPENRRALWESINNLKSSSRIILMTTHHLEEADFLSEDLIVMSKGEIIARGSPEKIKSDFGLGYQLSISGLSSTEEKSRHLNLFESYKSKAEIDSAHLEAKGNLKITFHQNTFQEVSELVSKLESESAHFTLTAPSLEQAYLNIDSSAQAHQEAFNKMSKKTSALLVKKFSGTTIGKLMMLVLRKYLILFNNNLQIFVITMAIFVPACLAYFWLGFNSGMSDNNRIYPGEIFILSLMIITYYFFAFSFFGMLPLTERVMRIRYLLKLNGVGTFSYYFSMIFCDALISWVVIYLSFKIVTEVSYEYVMINDEKVYYAMLSTWFWSLSFITQSYLVSYIFSNKGTAAKSLTMILFSGNVFSLFLQSGGLDREEHPSIWFFLDILFTAIPNYNRFNLEVDSADDISNRNIYTNALSAGIFFLMAMILDFLHCRPRKGDSKKGSDEDISIEANVDQRFDPVSIKSQKAEASDDTGIYSVQVDKVKKKFGNFQALKGVSMVLRENEILGLLGPNGAGKSTLFNIVSSYIPQTSGQIRYYGNSFKSFTKGGGNISQRSHSLEDDKNYSESVENRNQGFMSRLFGKKPSMISICAQDDILWFDLTVDQHLYLYSLMKGHSYVASEHWKILMDLDAAGYKAAGMLSTGMKRKLCYLLSMISNPKLKFLDECTSGLDPVSRNVMKNLMLLQRNLFGGSAIFTTHTMEDAETLCDRIAILVAGQLECVRSVAELKKMSGGMNITFIKNLDSLKKVRKYSESELGNNPDESYHQVEKDDQRAAKNKSHYLEKVFVNNFGETIIDRGSLIHDDNIRKMIFNAQKVKSISDLLIKLERLKIEGQIYDYELSHKSLEDLFLDLAKIQTKDN